MEELTIEQKAQRYDEALIWMQDLYPTMEGTMKEDAKHYFPELKESEEKMIKKEITELVMQPTWKTEKEFQRRKELCAWLEKQNSQNLANSAKTCNIEPKFKAGDRIIGIVSGIQYYISEVHNDYYFTETGNCIMFNAQDNFKLYEQKPTEWSEDDEKIVAGLNNCIDELEEVNGWRFTYVNDENVELCKIRNWLKSIKDRYTWKPSEEQLEALDDFIYAKYPNIEKHGASVKSLYQDLKKLIEE